MPSFSSAICKFLAIWTQLAWRSSGVPQCSCIPVFKRSLKKRFRSAVNYITGSDFYPQNGLFMHTYLGCRCNTTTKWNTAGVTPSWSSGSCFSFPPVTAGHSWLWLAAMCVQILKERVKSCLRWIKCAGVAHFSTGTVQVSLHEDEDLIVKPSAKLCTGLRSLIISSSVSFILTSSTAFC